jgi:predicted Na+-dependent transporter
MIGTLGATTEIIYIVTKSTTAMLACDDATTRRIGRRRKRKDRSTAFIRRTTFESQSLLNATMNEFNINSNVWIELCGSLLLFCLVWNMSASVDFDALQHQLHNQKAILTGLALQFLVMPFLGFTVVRVMQLPHEVSLILLVLCSSPGGSFSNFFCSLFNGDLALSG